MCGDGRPRPSGRAKLGRLSPGIIEKAKFQTPLRFRIGNHASPRSFWVAQRFQRCGKVARQSASAAEVLMAAPRRGTTGYSVYFITASTFQRSGLFQSDRMAQLFVEVLFHYRDQKNYLLHEFVLMPNHFHLLISPIISLERSLQLIKGGFSYRAKKELGFEGEIWEKSFYDRRVRDVE